MTSKKSHDILSTFCGDFQLRQLFASSRAKNGWTQLSIHHQTTGLHNQYHLWHAVLVLRVFLIPSSTFSLWNSGHHKPFIYERVLSLLSIIGLGVKSTQSNHNSAERKSLETIADKFVIYWYPISFHSPSKQHTLLETHVTICCQHIGNISMNLPTKLHNLAFLPPSISLMSSTITHHYTPSLSWEESTKVIWTAPTLLQDSGTCFPMSWLGKTLHFIYSS